MENKENKENKAKSGNRLAHLREIEIERQKEWYEKGIFNSKAEENWKEKYDLKTKNDKKFFITFPYPYMNGKLHLGHAFSMSKAEFQSRYQRLKGKNTLWPFGFHCTGMPIAAASKRVEKELKEQEELKNNPEKAKEKKDKNKLASQCDILRQLDVPEELIPKFKDPLFWLEYFPPLGMKDLKNFGLGIDFSRSFITTEKQPFYDKFVNWQMLKLKEKDKIKFGKRNAIFSISDNQPCADHDRSEGEGLGPQEFTLIKMKLLEENCPEKLLNLIKEGKNIFLVAATLRPETMYGQTNCYILPNGEYGLYEMANGEFYFTSQHAILNLAYQDKTKEPKKADPILTIKGKELIGCKLNAPLSVHKEVYLFPMETISMKKGTGIVTSVPSDSPDDYINIVELKKDEKLREKWGIKLEWIKDPVHILNLEPFGPLPAKDMCEKLQIKGPKDTEKLKKAKEEVYTGGFYKGILDIGPYKGEPIQTAKDKVKNDLIKSGEADVYFEPEGLITNRQNEECVVALVDQWYITYGDDDWKNFLLNYVKCKDKFNTYGESTRKAFENVLGWFSYWGLSRTFGLGSHIPWDPQYLIESLSDSTIYMSYYTIANYLHEDIFGKINKNGITPDMLTEEVFDYIFLGKELDFSKTQIKEDVLKEMRNSFTYWYPMDLRCSGKDLIGNHLTMSLYHHAAVWNYNEDMMTKGYFCNGYILVDGEKMAKHKGNFLTVEFIIEKYGCDASRIALADCGDSLDDANFVREVADKGINKLFSFENFVKILINEYWNKNPDFKIENPDLVKNYTEDFDKIFDNNINYLIEEAKNAYEEMKYKNVLKHAFYGMINSKDEYILFNNDDYSKLNPTLMVHFLRTFFIIINPILPHWTEYMYRTYLNPIFEKFGFNELKIEFLAFAKYPEISNPVDRKLFDYNNYINKVIESIRENVLKKMKNKNKGKKNDKKNNKKNDKKKEEKKEDEKKEEKKEEEKKEEKKEEEKKDEEKKEEEKKDEKKEEKKPIKVKILFAKEYNNNQKIVLEVLRAQKYDENGKLIDIDEKGNPLYKSEIIKRAPDGKSKSSMLEFASFKAKEVLDLGMDALKDSLLFNEEETLNSKKDLIKKLSKVDEIEIIEYKDELKPKGLRDSAMPGNPIYLVEE